MNKVITAVIVIGLTGLSLSGLANKASIQQLVEQDITSFQDFFKKKFPQVELADFSNGVYAIDQQSREQWEEIEDFPPYEFAVDEGEVLFSKPFANGKTYADCFDNKGQGIRQNFPYFDNKTEQVITLELAINQCREANNEKALAYKKDEITAISAYMAYTSRDNVFNVKVNNEMAYQAYLKGKQFFYSKRGQLNMSCDGCHMKVTGLKLRADIPSPALGHPTGFPTHRAKWQEMGTLHRRYAGCLKNIRAKPFSPQSETFRNLEFFQTVMSNGLVVNGPSTRK